MSESSIKSQQWGKQPDLHQSPNNVSSLATPLKMEVKVEQKTGKLVESLPLFPTRAEY